MKLLRCQAKNFGSYASFELDFSDQGLALIYGKTGSGKSTIPDVPSWILYGRTAKDGNADDVKSWFATEPTEGTISVELNGGETIDVTRIRGIKAGTNDLFWYESDGKGSYSISRGKDLVETQKLLERRLGISFEAYISGSYYHEFSPVGLFFSASAKQRREVFERLTEMATATALQEKSALARKGLKANLMAIKSERDRIEGALITSHRYRDSSERSFDNWNSNHDTQLRLLEDRAQGFQKEKEAKIAELEKKDQEWLELHSIQLDAHINELDVLNGRIKPKNHYDGQIGDLQGQIQHAKSKRCPTCSGPQASDDLEELQNKLLALNETKRQNIRDLTQLNVLYETIKAEQAAQSPYLGQLQEVESSENYHLASLEDEKNKSNPFKDHVDTLRLESKKLETSLLKVYADLGETEHKFNSLETLHDLSYELRGALLARSVQEIESATNDTLSNHFDGEFRVGFAIEGADNLEVSITKNGHPCVYKQLSKGQRQLLRLSFVTAVMAASANRAGCHFSTLFFDEGLDGLDSDLKVKAFSLFEELQLKHESIFVIDHTPEFQALFTNKYHVIVESDISVVECQ